mgnify:FL=1
MDATAVQLNCLCSRMSGRGRCALCLGEDARRLGDSMLDQAKELDLQWRDAEQFLPLILFRGNMSLGRAQTLWKFTLALRDAAVPNFTEAIRLSRAAPDFTHVLGLHAPNW